MSLIPPSEELPCIRLHQVSFSCCLGSQQPHGNIYAPPSEVDLCESLAATAKRICTCYVNPSGLSAFVPCCLIALDKCPGVRPIGIGKTARRLIGRVIARVLPLSDDIQVAAGPLQLCTGHQAGCESAVHNVSSVQFSEREAIILADPDIRLW